MSDPTLATVASDSGELGPSIAPAPRAAPQSPSPAQRVTPGSPEWAALTTEQRHEHLRGPENPRARGHSPARDQREAMAARNGNEPAPDAASTDTPSAASTERFKLGRYEISEAELAGMMEQQAVADQRRLTLPPSPEAYEAKLPADLKLPGDQTYVFDQNDPSLIAARNMAHAKGWSQQDFSEALGIFASHIAGQEAALAERSRAEIAKAGVNAPMRVDAVGRWITSMVGEADGKQIKSLIVTDSVLRFYESLMTKLTSQGSASFSQAHRVPAEDRGIPGYEKMSFEQRRAAQDQRAAQRR